jgi:hypothetical protein
MTHENGARTSPDPYQYIDGGETPGGSYQAINAPNFKATALIAYMFPDVQRVVNRPIFYEFAERFVANGTWTQPDPCAGFDGNPANLGVTFGPDGNGGCILDTDPSDGIGRYPQLHGANRDQGNSGYTSRFCNDMWTNFRQQVSGFNPNQPISSPSSSSTPNQPNPSSPATSPSNEQVSVANGINAIGYIVVTLFAIMC